MVCGSRWSSSDERLSEHESWRRDAQMEAVRDGVVAKAGPMWDTFVETIVDGAATRGVDDARLRAAAVRPTAQILPV